MAGRITRTVLSVPFSAIAVGCILFSGCGKGSADTAQVVDEGYVIRLDRAANGAADQKSTGAASRCNGPRALSFEMAGFAEPASDSSSQEQRNASQQAAVLEALGKAMIEARRTRGQPTADFTAKAGKRLTVTHRTVGNGHELDVSVVCRGEETHFVVRDGVLQHPPYDFKLLQRVFEETNGEFALLATDWNGREGRWEARVACYRPPGFDSALAGDAAEKVVDTP